MIRPKRPGGAQIIPRPDNWRHGDPPPWTDHGEGVAPISVEVVLAAVTRMGGPHPMEPLPGARPSAVLIALLDGPAGAEVLLTRRAWHLNSHKGEISFPGGRMDPGETPAETALREAYEEVLLDPELVEIHGELHHLSTLVSQSYIVPVVARLRRRPLLAPGTSEVDRILFVPLAELTRSDTYRQEVWTHPQGDWPITFFELDDETIWGATGRMLFQLLAITLAEAATTGDGAAIEQLAGILDRADADLVAGAAGIIDGTAVDDDDSAAWRAVQSASAIGATAVVDDGSG